jgi:hypothetical protein
MAGEMVTRYGRIVEVEEGRTRMERKEGMASTLASTERT